jgi:hypothetical protein
MKLDEAAQLRQAWGNHPCDHPSVSKEREDRGVATGDFICDQCGQQFGSREEWGLMASSRKKKCGKPCGNAGCDAPCCKPFDHGGMCYCSAHLHGD